MALTPLSRPLNPFEAMMAPIAFNITATFRIQGPVTADAVAAALGVARSQHWAMQVAVDEVGGRPHFVPAPPGAEAVPLAVQHGCEPEAWRAAALQASVDGVDTARGLFRALLLLHRPLGSTTSSSPGEAVASPEPAGNGDLADLIIVADHAIADMRAVWSVASSVLASLGAGHGPAAARADAGDAADVFAAEDWFLRLPTAGPSGGTSAAPLASLDGAATTGPVVAAAAGGRLIVEENDEHGLLRLASDFDGGGDAPPAPSTAGAGFAEGSRVPASCRGDVARWDVEAVLGPGPTEALAARARAEGAGVWAAVQAAVVLAEATLVEHREQAMTLQPSTMTTTTTAQPPGIPLTRGHHVVRCLCVVDMRGACSLHRRAVATPQSNTIGCRLAIPRLNSSSSGCSSSSSSNGGRVGVSGGFSDSSDGSGGGVSNDGAAFWGLARELHAQAVAGVAGGHHVARLTTMTGWLDDCSTLANNVGSYDRLGFAASAGPFAFTDFHPCNNGTASPVAWRKHLGCFATTFRGCLRLSFPYCPCFWRAETMAAWCGGARDRLLLAIGQPRQQPPLAPLS